MTAPVVPRKNAKEIAEQALCDFNVPSGYDSQFVAWFTAALDAAEARGRRDGIEKMKCTLYSRMLGLLNKHTRIVSIAGHDVEQLRIKPETLRRYVKSSFRAAAIRAMGDK